MDQEDSDNVFHSVLNFFLLAYAIWTHYVFSLLHLSFTFLCILFEIRDKNITVTKRDNYIDVYRGYIFIKRIRQEFKETRAIQELQKKEESDKNSRTQESWLARHFLPRQPRFYLHEPCQKVKICFFRRESCIVGMKKESWVITQKNKNLERTMSRSSTSAVTISRENGFQIAAKSSMLSLSSDQLWNESTSIVAKQTVAIILEEVILQTTSFSATKKNVNF
jgi:hypothetical protein